MTDETKDWVFDLGSTSKAQIEVLKQLLIHASQDEMNDDDLITCKEALEDMTGWCWLWKQRDRGEQLDTLVQLEPFLNEEG